MIPQQPDIANPKADTPVQGQVVFYRPTANDPVIDGSDPATQSPNLIYVCVIQAVNGLQVDLLVGQNAKTQFTVKNVAVGALCGALAGNPNQPVTAGGAEWTPYWNRQFALAAQAQGV